MKGARIAGFMAISDGTLHHLYVDPLCQGCGAGSALLDHAKAGSPRGLSLYTHQRNEHARAFYEKRGFLAMRFGVSPAPENEPDVLYQWRTDAPSDQPS